MSFQNKGFWAVKGVGHINDSQTVFDNSSKIEPKRTHEWFISAAATELFSNKKQAVEDTTGKSSSGSSNASFSLSDNNYNFQSVPTQFIDRLLGSETRLSNFDEKSESYVATEDSNLRRKMTGDNYEDPSFCLSISQAVEDSETYYNIGGIRKVKVNEVKESENDRYAPNIQNYGGEHSHDLDQAYSRENGTSSIQIGQAYNKENNAFALMGCNYNSGDAHVRPICPSYSKGDNGVLSTGASYKKEDGHIISFTGFPEEQDIIPARRPAVDYPLYNQSSVQASGRAEEKDLDLSNFSAIVNAPRVSKLKTESAAKNKPESKAARKEAPNSFPSNVRNLISTGILDGVPVKYVSLAREELCGIIKGTGYQCGCQSCNYNKVLNAYEFERHAGCKTKHPNNHIYFENGKTIYQIVQELKSTPESLLFDTIQIVFGAPINQKAFRIWKESFQAATRELERIYGKEELNL